MAILAIYPYSKNLHVAIWVNEKPTLTATFLLSSNYQQIISRRILLWLSELKIDVADLQFIVTSGHLEYQSCQDGLYLLSDLPLELDRASVGMEISRILAKQLHIDAFLVDPTCKEKCHPWAFVTGTPDIKRTCEADNFIMKYLAEKEAAKQNLTVQEGRFIIGNLGDEHQIAALAQGQVIDALSSLDEGPFALRHSGSLPFDQVIDLCVSSKDRQEALRIFHQDGGLRGYLKLEQLEDLPYIESEYSELIKEALVYQICKEIGALATVLKGEIHSIILTGELVNLDWVVVALQKRIGFLAPISLYPGNQAMSALLAGARRILAGEPILNLT